VSTTTLPAATSRRSLRTLNSTFQNLNLGMMAGSFFIALMISAASHANNSQSIPPGDGFELKLSNGNTQHFGGIAAQLCAKPNAFIPSSRMRFSKESSISEQSKELAASFLIYAPLVSEVVTVLTNQEMPLAKGDRVLVYACGCVQTGGTGSTWKSYVHPLGKEADHLYSGTIQFLTGPTPPNFLSNPTGMQKIEDFTKTQGNGFIVPNDTTFLSLGYLDDHHSDDGYYKHDNGNDDQCKDVGPAALEIAVFHAGAAR
jgi:hypothetical protein